MTVPLGDEWFCIYRSLRLEGQAEEEEWAADVADTGGMGHPYLPMGTFGYLGPDSI